MTKNFALRSSITKVNGKVISTYERLTNATSQQQQNIGLDPQANNYEQVAVAGINEYIQLIGLAIPKGKRCQWKIGDIGQELEIDNIYVQTPSADSFDIELYDSTGTPLLDLTIDRGKELVELPNSLLTKDLTLKVYARQHIGLIAINCRPAVLLGKFAGQIV